MLEYTRHKQLVFYGIQSFEKSFFRFLIFKVYNNTIFDFDIHISSTRRMTKIKIKMTSTSKKGRDDKTRP